MSQTILYIEDNEANADLIRAIGKSAGYRILIANEGKGGIAQAQEHQPDLIICDYHLPGMNGHDIVRALRADNKTQHIPIMMLTADIYSGAESLELGVDAYLNKPIRRNMFLTNVERVLKGTSDDSPPANT